MSPHLGSVALLAAFVFGMLGLLKFIHRTGRQILPVTGIWGLLVSGYLLTGARFVYTMETADWTDGIVGFVALCGALPVAHLIRQVCPRCRRRQHLVDEVVTPPTRQCPGMGATVWNCAHCGHHEVCSHTIPLLAETSKEAGSWSPVAGEMTEGGYGATYAAGDGGGASWGASEAPASDGQ